jgi:acylphosphatase
MADGGQKRVQTRSGQRFFIAGRVQGVGYRAFAVAMARRIGVAGWARNLDDGRVEVHAEGSRAQLEEFEQHLRKGPPFAEVTDVEAREAAASSVQEFSIAHGAATAMSKEQS